MYHLLHICCNLVPEICVHPEIFRVFRYIDVVRVHDCQDTSLVNEDR